MKIFLKSLPILFILSLFILSCDLNGGIGVNEKTPYEFDKDGKIVKATAYFNNDGVLVFPPIGDSSRALSDTLAKSSYNHFEVVFYGGDTATVTRVSWDYNESAFIDVKRGIDYGAASINTPTDTHGAAAIFIGRRDVDSTNEEIKHLFAVGLLSHVDGKLGSEIKEDSEYVTFTVSSLEAGIWANPFITYSSTDFSEITFIDNIVDAVPVAKFPALNLTSPDLDAPIPYKLKFKDGSNNKWAAIRSVKPNPDIEIVDPSFIYNGTIVPIVSTVNVTSCYIDNIVSPGSALPSDGILLINFSNPASIPAGGGITSFCLNIPVYAVTDADAPANIPWFLSSGFGILDDGSFMSSGGCILLIIGGTGSDKTHPIVP